MAGKKLPIFVSHFTKKTPYEKEVLNLQKSLKKFNLDYHIEGIKSLGSWRANSNWCAWQVQAMLKRYPNRDILRLDCDAIVQRNPSLFLEEDFNADIAAVVWKNSKMRPGGEFLGGTMFFRNNPLGISVVDEWVDFCKGFPDKRNGDLLESTIKSYSVEVLNFQKLPLSYCCIFDLMKSEVSEPVIEHFQASRRFKAGINEGIYK